MWMRMLTFICLLVVCLLDCLQHRMKELQVLEVEHANIVLRVHQQAAHEVAVAMQEIQAVASGAGRVMTSK
jgi:hypothetical protein